MILRVPDYYDEFACIADRCKGSCCAGWEIDIDDETREHYCRVTEPIGERLRDKLYRGEDGEYRFRLSPDGRCPFLNEHNLCDIYTALGEQALSEVCTDFPRFSLSYGTVMQRVLSISCEEVGKIIFTRSEPVTYVERPLDVCEDAWVDEDADLAFIGFLEKIQQKSIDILQQRQLSLQERIARFLGLCEGTQEVINHYDEYQDETRFDAFLQELDEVRLSEDARVGEWGDTCETDLWDAYDVRFAILEELEELGPDWVVTKENMRKTLTQESYVTMRRAYVESSDYQELAYEQLLVYFAFRYLMQAVYSYDLLAYAKMIVTCTMMIRDLDIMTYHENGGRLSIDDRIDTAHIFSREVEHSEENFEQLREELMFE